MVVDDHELGHRVRQPAYVPRMTATKDRKERLECRPADRSRRRTSIVSRAMAKDTEKLIRQLSLISYLMAERRPVTALEIRRDVEGYSGMNEDAFARRFYADRAELESLGIQLTVDQPADGVAEQENYSLRPENFHLPAIAFTDEELASLQFALTLLDGEFAYAEPLRLALQQISWGRPSPLHAPEQGSLALGITGSAGGHDLSQRLAKIETAIFRHKTITFDYYTMERDEVGARKVDPYHLLFQGGQFYLLGRSHERDALRVFRLSRIRGKVAYATKAEHDFKRPDDFDPRAYANRADWQFGDADRHRRGVDLRAHRLAGRASLRPLRRVRPGEGRRALHDRLRQRAPARLVGAQPRRARARRGPAGAGRRRGRARRAPGRAPRVRAARWPPRWPRRRPRRPRTPRRGQRTPRDRDPPRALRAPRHAGVDPHRGRARRRAPARGDVCERLQISEAELREDVNVLNVVNFGGGSYVLYAEVRDDGRIEVDPEPYSDNFARPARLLPVEAKALVAAIDLIGEHLPEGALTSAREKIVAALGDDPMEQGLQVATAGGDDSEIARVVSRGDRRAPPAAPGVLQGQRGRVLRAHGRALRAHQRPRGLVRRLLRPRQGRRPPLPPGPHQDGRGARRARSRRARRSTPPPTSRAGRAPARSRRRAPRACGSRPSAPAGRASSARVAQELADGSLVVELPYKGADWLVREVLKEAGDAAGPRAARGARGRAPGGRQAAGRGARLAVAAARWPESGWGSPNVGRSHALEGVGPTFGGRDRGAARLPAAADSLPSMMQFAPRRAPRDADDYGTASSSNRTRAWPWLRSLPQRSAIRSRIRQPMPCLASGGGRPGIADVDVLRAVRVHHRVQLDAVERPELTVLDAVGRELGDDELDLPGPPRRQRQRLDGATREDDARGVRWQELRRLVVWHSRLATTASDRPGGEVKYRSPA